MGLRRLSSFDAPSGQPPTGPAAESEIAGSGALGCGIVAKASGGGGGGGRASDDWWAMGGVRVFAGSSVRDSWVSQIPSRGVPVFPVIVEWVLRAGAGDSLPHPQPGVGEIGGGRMDRLPDRLEVRCWRGADISNVARDQLGSGRRIVVWKLLAGRLRVTL